MPAAVLAVSVLLAAYFAFAAIPWLARIIGPAPRERQRRSQPGRHERGMGAMLLAML